MFKDNGHNCLFKMLILSKISCRMAGALTKKISLAGIGPFFRKAIACAIINAIVVVFVGYAIGYAGFSK